MNEYKKLKLEDIYDRFFPRKIKFFDNKKIIGISCGISHSIFWTEEEIYGCGGNPTGQLGLGNNENRNIPEKIKFFENKKIIGIFCGLDHSNFWTEEEIYGCGNNDYGQLGLGDQKNRNIPEKIPKSENFIPPLNLFDPFKKEKILLLCLSREYEDSLFHKDYLPFDMFKLILKESRLYYNKVNYIESVYYEEEFEVLLKKQKNE